MNIMPFKPITENKQSKLGLYFAKLLGTTYLLHDIKGSSRSGSFTKALITALNYGEGLEPVKGLNEDLSFRSIALANEVKKQLVNFSNKSNNYEIQSYYTRKRNSLIVKAFIKGFIKKRTPVNKRKTKFEYKKIPTTAVIYLEVNNNYEQKHLIIRLT